MSLKIVGTDVGSVDSLLPDLEVQLTSRVGENSFHICHIVSRRPVGTEKLLQTNGISRRRILSPCIAKKMKKADFIVLSISMKFIQVPGIYYRVRCISFRVSSD
jgi:hypothetical protein